MLFSQLVDDDLGCASYLVGCEVSREVVAVDPPFATEQLLAEASHHGARIVRVVETHTHADHVSGHGRLALEHRVPVSIHPDADVDYPHDALSDGGEITVGNVTLRCIHTPGHRPEHCCLTVTDRTRAEEPWLLLTGDSLFVGDAARPDLAVEAREGAEGLFHSLQRLLELPDGVEVYPGHVAGSLCGRSMSSKASTTIGFERRFNPMLRLNLVDDFVAESGSVAAPKPPNAARIVELNRGPWVGPPDDAQELDAPPAETQLLDARPIGDFLAGHRRGSFSVPVSGKSFATRAAFVLDPEEQVTVVARDAGEAERAIRGLRSVAVLGISGYLLGEGRERMDPVSLEELEQLIASDAADVIDVREKDERDAGYIPGSRNIPYRLMRLCCPDLPADRSLVTICESGARATIAASILRTRGYHARPVAHAGMEEWLARGGDSVSFRRCGSG